MSTASHGACGKSWEQSGNRTSHCGGCHETFVSLSVFDAHRRESRCLAPADVKYLKSGLAVRANGIWYSPASAAAAASHFGNDQAQPSDDSAADSTPETATARSVATEGVAA